MGLRGVATNSKRPVFIRIERELLKNFKIKWSNIKDQKDTGKNENSETS